MTCKEIRILEIPAASFLKGTKSNLYVGPKLSWLKRRRLRKVESKYNVVYPYELFDAFSREIFEYNFPGVPFPEAFSVDTFYKAIRESVGKDLTPESICFIRHDGESFVLCVGNTSFKQAIAYLVQNGDKFKPASSDDDVRFRIVEEEVSFDKAASIIIEEPEEDSSDIMFSTCASEEEPGDTMFKTIPPREDIYKRMREIEELLHPSDIRFRAMSRPTPLPNTDDKFDAEMVKAAAEVRQAIEALIMTGYPVEIIKSWLQKPVELSRLRITKQFKIILVDYDKEIKMGPLPKTVFLFYLRHPEGVRFSYLQDYVKELRHIYGHVSVNDDLDKMNESINALTNPLNNSICEKCAAIKKAFVLQVNNEIAQNYYITGMQGGAKGITLDRNLVEWECKL